MAGLLDGIDLRTKLAGQNRLELLLFFLHGRQRFGINVFKVQEVITRPALTHLPNAHPVVCGVATMRGKTIPVIDLSSAISMAPLSSEPGGHVVITEYNRSVQGFLVRAVDRIINVNWGQVHPPPDAMGHSNYLTAITELDDEMIELIDVEMVLSEIGGMLEPVALQTELDSNLTAGRFVLVVDDSSVARSQVTRTLNELGLEHVVCKNGREAYELLCDWADNQPARLQDMVMVISDIEMPEMDGYTLTSRIRQHEKLKTSYVLLHTSLSGVFNESLVKKVGANGFLSKFSFDELAALVVERLSQQACP
ncbi:MAG TPA: chemotaxis protein CheV [Gammaproteobacteria bacterium]|nr:chemotaxis protein CheV [Gammaproteobacteria bacterium]